MIKDGRACVVCGVQNFTRGFAFFLGKKIKRIGG
jgi:hypothetical protein